MKKLPFASLAACTLMLAACGTGSLQVADAWARPAPASELSAAYFTVRNGTGEADMLIGASTDAAGATELHTSMPASDGESGMMTMMPVERVEVPAGGEVAFEPGGYHVMLFDLQQELVVGDHFTMTLHFAVAGDVDVDVHVAEP
jgi:copper(I)-binding protein